MAFTRKKNPDEVGNNSANVKTKKVRAAKTAKPSKSKAKRFVLIIGDEGTILVFMQGVKVIRRLFAPSAQPTHSEAMVDLMRGNPSAPIYVLMDVMDQQYVPQTFPPVSSLSVGGLVKRRLDRDFQPDDFKGSLQIGRDKAGRKEWKFLLIALAKTPLVNEWLACIVDLPNELKGIYLVPIEAVNYIDRLGKRLSNAKPSSWQLLFSHNKISGFRQVVMRNNKLVFTRVSQAIDDAIPAVIAGNIEQEIINTIEYLKRLEFRDSADIDATVIVSQDVIESLDLKRFNFAQARAITPLNVANALGLEQAALSADRFGDVVMAAAFGIQKKHVLRFSNAYIEKLAKLYKARKAIIAVAALGVIGLLALGGMVVAAMITDYGLIADAKSKAQRIQNDLEKMKKSVDGLNQNVAFKSAFVASYDAYIKDVPKPEDFIVAMAPFITPQARVVSLSWDNTSTAVKTGASPGAATVAELPIAITMEVDFSGAGNTLEVIDPVAKAYVAMITEKLPQYDIKHAPFPWQESDAANAASVEVELNAASAVTVKDTKVKFTISGVKKVDGAVKPTPQVTP